MVVNLACCCYSTSTTTTVVVVPVDVLAGPLEVVQLLPRASYHVLVPRSSVHFNLLKCPDSEVV